LVSIDEMFYVPCACVVVLLLTYSDVKNFLCGQPFFYMVFACCVNVYKVSVHTSST